jgi:hypothetical protein
VKLSVAILAAMLSLTFALPAEAVKRDPKARAAFKRAHPCPATGKLRGACPGYVVDHIRPLCAGGPDRADNMQWQTVAEAKVKDRLEAAECRKTKRGDK